jgi:hypothetical protein
LVLKQKQSADYELVDLEGPQILNISHGSNSASSLSRFSHAQANFAAAKPSHLPVPLLIALEGMSRTLEEKHWFSNVFDTSPKHS